MDSLLSSFLGKIFKQNKYNGTDIYPYYGYIKVEYYFKNNPNPIIFINDINHYITTIKFIFKDNRGNQVDIFVNNDKEYIYYVFSDYLKEIDHSELDIKDIQFIYNNTIIKYIPVNINNLLHRNFNYVEPTKINEYFKIDYTKINNEFHIFVNDINNLIKVINTFKYNQTDKVEIITNKKKQLKN